MHHRKQIGHLSAFIVVLIHCWSLSLPAEGKDVMKILVESMTQLQKAVSVANPGDIIVLADGTYDESCTLSAKGTAEHPIVIRAQNSGKVNIQNRVTVNGEYVSLVDFCFSHKGSVAIKGRGCRLSRCQMSNVQAGKWVTVAAGSKSIEIDHCLFENKKNNTELERDCQLIQLVVLNEKEQHHIHHNHFRDIPKGATGNGFETIQLITQGNPRDPDAGHSETIIENNLFERCNGEAEIISMKANGNLIRGNTFRACRGAIVFRHGDKNTASYNFFFGDGESGSGGVRLQGTDHVVANNYFSGLGTWGVSMMDGTEDNFYVRVERTQVLFNTFLNCKVGLRVGVTHSKYPNGLTPKQCLIAGNIFYAAPGSDAGPIMELVNGDQPEAWRWAENIAYGELGIPTVEGIDEEDPQLRVLDTGLAVPTQATPSAEQLPEEVVTPTVDISGNTRGQKKTLGAIAFPVKANTGPLSAKQVGPRAPEPSNN